VISLNFNQVGIALALVVGGWMVDEGGGRGGGADNDEDDVDRAAIDATTGDPDDADDRRHRVVDPAFSGGGTAPSAIGSRRGESSKR
jgi:hypothetical protein